MCRKFECADSVKNGKLFGTSNETYGWCCLAFVDIINALELGDFGMPVVTEW